MTHTCSKCGNTITCSTPEPKTYRYRVDDTDVSALRKIHQYVLEQGTYLVDMRQVHLNHTEHDRTTQLRFHGLLAKARNAKGAHIPATWVLTRRAADFLRGTLNIPKYVYTKKNVVIGHSDELVSKRDFRILDDFGPHWDAIELTDGNVRIVPKVAQATLL